METKTQSGTQSGLARLLVTFLTLAIAATITALASSAGTASAIAPQCYASIEGNSVAHSGGRNCYFVVVRAEGNWGKVCEDYGTRFSCTNLSAGKYQLQAWTIDSRGNWRGSFARGEVKGNSGGSCDKLFTVRGDIAGGHADGSCYYVVMSTNPWKTVCRGTLFPRGCAGRFGDLPRGEYKVDVYSTSSWGRPLYSHKLFVR